MLRLSGRYALIRPTHPFLATVLSANTQSRSGALAEQIRRIGARATPARIRVLQLLREAPAALTHNEIEAALGDLTVDRVTLYRVLDWLVESGLAHKNADASRVYRFSAAPEGVHTTHVHFRCEHCGGVFCLNAPPPLAPELPPGFSLSRVDFDLRGQCANCARSHR
jgi:Fur family ferric uptake transcriptional regulator